MNNKEIEELKSEIYNLISNKRGSEEEKILEKILILINYTQELKDLITDISRIGGKHTL